MYGEVVTLLQRVLSFSSDMGRAGGGVLSILQVPPSLSIGSSVIYTGQVITAVTTLALVYIGLDVIRRYFKVLVATGVGLAVLAVLAKFPILSGAAG